MNLKAIGSGMTMWTTLRAIVGSRAAQLSIVFPLFGYIVLFTDLAENLLSSNAALSDRTWLGPTIRIYLIYLGLFLLGVGAAIYSIACPWITKQFANSEACASFHVRMADLRHVLEVVDKFPRRGDPSGRSRAIRDEIGRRREDFEKDRSAWRQFASEEERSIYSLHVSWFWAHQGTRRPARYACAMFVYGGLAVLVLPSADTFVAAMSVCLDALGDWMRQSSLLA